MHDFDDNGHEHDDDTQILETEGITGEVEKNALYYADNIEMVTVGIDVGSSTSHLMFSRLHLQRLGRYLSSRYVVVEREMLYQSPILLTPYRPDYTIDIDDLDNFFQDAYKEAGYTPADVDSGAVILTGEAVKRRNARAIADLFASQAGKFVCASAGHNLEAIMAAHGSGAVGISQETGDTVLNVDVGGGTSKFSLIKDGQVMETAAISVGGRLLAMDEKRNLVRIEPSAQEIAESVGVVLELDKPLAMEDEVKLADALADCLFSMIRRTQMSPLADSLLVTPNLTMDLPFDSVVFSGGVSEYIYEQEDRDFGDIAKSLARAISSRTAEYKLPAPPRLGDQRIRATVIGASQFTVQVSGNTISITNTELLPLRNIPVIHPILSGGEEVDPEEMSQAIQRSFQRLDLVNGEQEVALTLDWTGTPRYQLLRKLADGIALGLAPTIKAGLPIVVVFNHDFGKLIGEMLRRELNITNDIISIDGIFLKEFDYVDIGELIFPANVTPVVIKSLVFPEVASTTAQLSS